MRRYQFGALLLPIGCLFAVHCSPAAPEVKAPTSPILSASASTLPVATASAAPNYKTVKTELRTTGLDPDALDRTADPCQDFYQFACGGWIAKAQIPADKPRWGRFQEIAERNEEELHKILEAAKEQASQPKADAKSDIVKLGTFYGACMDEATAEKQGVNPIKELLAIAARVKDAKTLAAAITELHRREIWALFDNDPEQDFKDATRMIARLDQNGLGLPDRDYYVKDDDKSKKLRETYVGHVERMMKLLGHTPAQAKQAAADVMDIETELARASKTRVERRDVPNMYNKIDRSGLSKAAPSFPWDDYFRGIGRADAKDVNVTSVKYFEALEGMLKKVKAPAWRNYLQWHIARKAAPSLSKAFDDERFSMIKAITGQEQQRPRWKRCIEATDVAMGELLAQPFVEKKFGGESRAAAEKMVHAISDAFADQVNHLDWMSAQTKAKAQEKRAAMAYLIGYPSKWKTYEFALNARTHAANVLASSIFNRVRELDKIGKPVDRNEWHMSPPTVNAYYDPQVNQMVFPAGILQPPFYSAAAAIPVNLGAIGMVVGHELTHGFDDEGSQFDRNGNMAEWWTDTDRQSFKGKTQCVAKQYSEYEPLPGVKINGELTLGENIADMGGVKLAFAAYRQMRKDAQERTVADGFSEDQQFFLAVGQAWCSKYKDDYARLQVQTDPHSNPRFRVNGSLSNLPEFGDAFSCKVGTTMRPTTPCTVW
jgi:putative endopeptidase